MFSDTHMRAVLKFRILFMSILDLIIAYFCILASVVLSFVAPVLAKILAGKKASKITYFLLRRM